MKSNHFFLFFMLILGLKITHAQSLEWATQFQCNNASSLSRAITVDNLGNVYTIGSYQGTVDFDPSVNTFNLTSAGNTDIFISKLDAFGNFVWAKSMGDARTDIGYDIKADNQGNIYTIGVFQDTIDIDPGSGISLFYSANGLYDRDVFMQKLDTNGDLIWAKQFDGNTTYYGKFSLELDNNGNIYANGAFDGWLNFDMSMAGYIYFGSAGTSMFVLKLDSLANIKWIKNIAATPPYSANNNILPKAIKADKNGSLYFTGSFSGNYDFDPSSTNSFPISAYSNSTPYIIKLDTAGNFVWGEQINGIATPNALVIDSLENIYTTGYFEQSFDLDPNPSVYAILFCSNSMSDIYISKLDSNGVFVWGKQFSSSNLGRANSMEIDAAANLYLTGYHAGTTDFDPNPNTHNLSSLSTTRDFFIAKLNSAGNFVWARSMGGSQNDEAADICLDANNNIYTTGTFFGIVDFDPSINNVFNLNTMTNFKNIFVQKLANCPNMGATITQTACDSYFHNGELYTTTGTYTQMYESIWGCDSIVTLNLTISHSSSHFIPTNFYACDSFSLNGHTYYSNGTFFQYQQLTQTLTNAAGCDSTLTFNLIMSRTIHDTLSETVCDAFTWNGQTYTSSGIYTQNFINPIGCDSIVTVNLTVNHAVFDTLPPQIACKSYTIFGSNLEQSGIYEFNFSMPNGCDSTLVLNLTINNPEVSVTSNGTTLTANANNADYQWINCATGLGIVGATTQTFTPNVGGNYAVIVTQNNCTDTSDCFTIYNTNISENTLAALLQAYPNPTNKELTIELGHEYSSVEVSILSVIGQELFTQKYSHSQFLKVTMPELKGMYFVNIKTPNAETVTIKVAKE